MVVYKLEKTGNAIFYSHHDFMRLFLLCLKRAGVVNKNDETPKVYFSIPTHIGCESRCEYVEMDLDARAHILAENLKTYLPEGVNIVGEYNIKNKIGISKIINLVKYKVNLSNFEAYQKKIANLLNSEDFKIELKMNNIISSCIVKDSIYKHYFENGNLIIFANVGETNLNIVQTMFQIFKKLNIENTNIVIEKVNQFSKIDSKYYDLELLILKNAK